MYNTGSTRPSATAESAKSCAISSFKNPGSYAGLYISARHSRSFDGELYLWVPQSKTDC